MTDRVDQSCKACKERHLKCSSETPCHNCDRLQIECFREELANFRSMKSRRFPKNQIWVRTTEPITFLPSDPELEGLSVGPEEPGGQTTIPTEASQSGASPVANDNGRSSAIAAARTQFDRTSTPQDTVTDPLEDWRPRTGSRAGQEVNDHPPNDAAPPVSTSSLHGDTHQGFGLEHCSNDPLTRQGGALSEASDSRSSPRYCLNTVSPMSPLSSQERTLVNYFFQTLAPWYDFLDMYRRFTAGAYRLLPISKPLLFAILSVASRHLSALGNYNSTASEEYHQKCLELLIPALSKEDFILNDDILAATVVLRQRAEFEAYATGSDDNHCHILGAYELIGYYDRTGALSEFRKCVGWIGLRQELHVGLIKQQSIMFPLRHFTMVWDEFPGDNADWGNLMVYHAADVLNHCCGPESLTLEQYDQLMARGEAWLDQRPHHFQPMYYEAASIRGRFPILEYLGDVSISAIGYYFISSILLAHYHPCRRRLGTIPKQLIAELDATIEDRLRNICGLALSNSDCASAVGLACLVIDLCQDRFDHRDDRAVFEDISHLARHKHAWPIRNRTTASQK